MSDTTYWGILCRTCEELVAFDIAHDPSFGTRAANHKPGAIRCSQGHNHIYFPGDFQFFASELPITEAEMELNCAAYGAINPDSPLCAPRTTTANTQTKPLEVFPATLENELDPSLAPDPRRESARVAARNRWAQWGLKKMM